MIAVKDARDGKNLGDLSDKAEFNTALFAFEKWSFVKKVLQKRASLKIGFSGDDDTVGQCLRKFSYLPMNKSEISMFKSYEFQYALISEAVLHYIKSCMYFLSALSSWSNHFLMPGEVLLYYSKFFSIIGLSQFQMKSIVNLDNYPGPRQRKTYRISCLDFKDAIFGVSELGRGSPHKQWWYTFHEVYSQSNEAGYQHLWSDNVEERFLDTWFRGIINYSADIANDEIYYSSDFLASITDAYNLPVFDDQCDMAFLYDVFPDVAFAVAYIKYFTEKIKHIIPYPNIDYKKNIFRNFRLFLNKIPQKFTAIKSFEGFFLQNFFKE